MTDQPTPEPPRAARPVPWRWMLFGLSIFGLVALMTYWAMDRENVVWEDGKPECPHCRSEVEFHSRVCRTCRQGYDWVRDERLCDLCLTESDVVALRSIPENELEAALAAVGDEKVRAGIRTWLAEIRKGACVYCGGTGRDLWARTPNGETAPDCPVCLGDGDCVLCDGDLKVVVGDLGAHRDLVRLRERWSNLRGRLNRARPEDLQETLEDGIERLRGYDEMQFRLGDEDGPVDRATLRRDDILKALPVRPR
jgi:hypothetical protein